MQLKTSLAWSACPLGLVERHMTSRLILVSGSLDLSPFAQLFYSIEEDHGTQIDAQGSWFLT